MKKIAMILHTTGIEYDDRIRKEMLTMMNLFPDIKFKIFAIIDGKQDKEESGVSDYGVEYYIPFLKTRTKYKPGTHLFAKAWDFYRTVKPMLNGFDAIWCADFDILFFILLCNKPKVWDMHELPTIFLGSSIKQTLLKLLMNKCIVVIHANENRLNYLKSINALSNEDNQLIIRNFPAFDEKAKTTDDIFNAFKVWKGDSQCVYLQGLIDRNRSAIESVSAVMNLSSCKGVVVGNFKNDCLEELQTIYGPELQERIFFTGRVPQQMTPHYIRECSASLVLYKNVRANNYYCEPNRMFQSIMNDCPVVVGCNPPMKELVDRYGFGEVLADDGQDVNSISVAIEKILTNKEHYLDNISKNKEVITWDKQCGIFYQIHNKLFNK